MVLTATSQPDRQQFNIQHLPQMLYATLLQVLQRTQWFVLPPLDGSI